MGVVVTGIGLVSALGNLTATWQALMTGQSGIQRVQPWVELPSMPLAMVGQQPIALEPLIQQVVRDALVDAGLAPPLPDCGVVVGSSRAHQGQWERLAQHFYRGDPSPPGLANWLATLPNGAAITTARLLGSQTIVLSPMAACATGLWAIAQGVDLIRTGTCQRVLVGAVEAPVTPLTLTGFSRMGALAHTGAYPFDRDRQGLVLGEAGAVFVLESADLARARGAQVYGQICGFGLTADGYHVSAPEVGSRAAAIAVNTSLTHSHRSAAEIDYIHAHGTATLLNDRNEAQLIQKLFPHGVAVSSTKGATGHAIGASGALGIAFCLMALKHQILPPTVGLQHPDFALDFVLAPRPTGVNTVLCLGFGFGGQNAAIVLSRDFTG